MEEKQTLICDKCKVEMVDSDVRFNYLNHNFRHKVKALSQAADRYV